MTNFAKKPFELNESSIVRYDTSNYTLDEMRDLLDLNENINMSRASLLYELISKLEKLSCIKEVKNTLSNINSELSIVYYVGYRPEMPVEHILITKEGFKISQDSNLIPIKAENLTSFVSYGLTNQDFISYLVQRVAILDDHKDIQNRITKELPRGLISPE
jgi:hypothetical protein